MCYVLITCARNEELFLPRTIESVVAQSLLPLRWIIVSDGSTDRTDAIVPRWSAEHPFIRLVRVDGGKHRGVRSKVEAFRRGYRTLEHLQFEFIGNLDADIVLPPDYFANLIERYRNQPELGVAGGVVREASSGSFTERYPNLNSVCGAVQLFRRRCFEQIGGYRHVRLFGEDAVAEISARMFGWHTRTFPDLHVQHQRITGITRQAVAKTRVLQGTNDYLMGYHPLFFLCKMGYKVVEKPYLLGSLLMLWGYVSSALRRERRSMPPELVAYLRKEQLGQLRTMVRSLLNFSTNR